MTRAWVRAGARWRNSAVALTAGVLAAVAANSFGLAGGAAPSSGEYVILSGYGSAQHGSSSITQTRIDLPPVTPTIG